MTVLYLTMNEYDEIAGVRMTVWINTYRSETRVKARGLFITRQDGHNDDFEYTINRDNESGI